MLIALALLLAVPAEPARVQAARGRIEGAVRKLFADAGVEELYVIAADARAAGARIEAHFFPGRLDEAGYARLSSASPQHAPFWDELRPGFLLFESSKRPPRVRIDKDGRYRISERR